MVLDPNSAGAGDGVEELIALDRSADAEAGALRRATARGAGWSAVTQLVGQALQLVTALVVTHLLVPRDFGLAGMVLVFFALATLVSDFGLFQAIVQRKEIRDKDLSTAFWIQCTLGVVCMVLAGASGPLLVRFFHEPRLRMVAWAMAPGFLLSALGTVHQALLVKTFRFKQLGVSRVITAVVAGAAAIGVAAAGGGVWALITMNLANAGVASAAAWALSGWQPKFRFDVGSARSLMGYSSKLFGSSVMAYGTQNLDNTLVGKMIGTSALGLYVRGFSLVLAPNRQVTNTLGQVMFASLTRIADQVDRARAVYLRTLGAIAVVTFPMMLGLSLVCDDFVRGLMGPKWVGAITIMRLFAVIGALSSIATTFGWIYESQGRADLLLWWSVIAGGFYMICIVVGALAGTIETVALGVVVSYAVLMVPGLAIPGRLIGMRVRDALRAMAGPTFATGGMLLAVLVPKMLLRSTGPLPRLLIEVAVGVLAYASIVHFARVRAYVDLRTVALETVRKSR